MVRYVWVVLVQCSLILTAGCVYKKQGPQASPQLTEQQKAEIERVSKPKLPNRWFAVQRQTGSAIPEAARTRALDARNIKKRGAESTAEDGVDATPGVWVSEGPENIGGRITSMAVDPNDPDRIWMGSADGGVWLSEDAGDHWTPMTDSIPWQSIGSVTTHPSDSNIVYVGGGEDNGGGYSYDGEGVLKTVDGGLSWQNIGLAEVRRIGRIVLDPVNPETVFVCAGGSVFEPNADRGVYRSTDGGATWSQVLYVADDTGCGDLAIDPSNPNHLYAGMWQRMGSSTDIYFGGNTGGLWQSTDGGDTWTETISTLPQSNVGRIGLAVAASNPDVVYARYQFDTGGFNGIWKTTNAGTSWTKVDGSGFWRFFMASYGYYFGQIRVDPSNEDIVYLLDVYWFRSTNGGVGFQQFTSGLHVDHHDLIIQPGKLLMGNDGGFYSSTNGGTSWFKSLHLPISQAYDIAIDALDTNRRFMGLQDNGTVRTTSGGFSDWTNILGGDGLQCEVDPTNSNLVYASSQGGNLNRSTDGGDSFSNGTNGIGNERTNWNAPVEHDPNVSQKLYTGTYRVYRTLDGMQNWTVVSPDLTDPAAHDDEGEIIMPRDQFGDRQSHLADLVDRTVTTIDASPVDGTVIWAGTDDGNVWVTQDDTATWTQVNVPGRDEWVTRVTADLFDRETAYVTFSGFRDGDQAAHVFRTTDLGATWVDISGDLPNVPLNDIVLDPDWEGRLMVGSDLGVFLSDSDGQVWDAMGSEMPAIVIHDLVLDQGTRTLWSGTHARSLWSFDLNQLPTPDRDLDGVDNLTDCAPEDGGAFAVPGEVDGVQWSSAETFSWNSEAPSAGSATTYDILQGESFPVGSGSEFCLADDLSDTQFTDTVVDPPGQVRWYLVRAQNVCGTGIYGDASDGTPRSSGACP